MGQVIIVLHNVLNLLKGFNAGYSTATFQDGKMLIEHEGVRYFLRIERVEHPSESIAKDIDKLKYWT